MSADNICMGCMKEIGQHEKQCPYCGFSADSAQLSPYLPIRTVLGNRFVIGKMLEYNGEGATYIAWDSAENKSVCIREFFPATLAVRMIDGVFVMQKAGCENDFDECCHEFVTLWSKLARMSSVPAIQRAYGVFEDNGTAYAVFEYVDSITLREFLLNSKTGYISWDKARQLLMPVLSALEALHANGIIHRGLSPHTLLVGQDGRIVISGFCIAAARTSRSEVEAQLFPGYTAIEQYGYKGQQGSWTDIYAFGAVLYRALIGTDPIEATTRVTNDKLMVPGKFAEQLPAYVINGLVNSLQILPEDRTETVRQLHAEITASPSAPVAEEQFVEARRNSVPQRRPVPPAQQNKNRPKKKNNESLMIALKAAAICVAVGLIAFAAVSIFILPDEYNVFKRFSDTSTTESVVQDSAEYSVPYFVSKNYTEIACSDYYKTRFKFVPEYVFDDTVENGYIISQDIAPQTMVKAGTEIRLKVSKGLEKVTLPNVIGWDYEDAYEHLTSLGFVVTKTENANDGSHTEGEVIAMNKTPEIQYDMGEKITLRIYAYMPTTTTTTEPQTEAPETEPETNSDPTEAFGTTENIEEV